MIDIKNLKFAKLIICGIYYLLYISNIVEKKKEKRLTVKHTKTPTFSEIEAFTSTSF